MAKNVNKNNSKTKSNTNTKKQETNLKSKNTKKQETSNIKKEETQNKKQINEVETRNSDIKKIVILVMIILAVFIVFYIVTIILNKDKHDDIFPKANLGNAEIQYDKIIAGTILKQSPSTYYVLATKKEDDNTEEYESILNEYKSYEYDHKIYTVDLDDALNKNSVSDESSFDSNIKFKGNTLLKIEDKEIIDVYEDSDDIKEKLNNLLTEVKDKKN